MVNLLHIHSGLSCDGSISVLCFLFIAKIVSYVRRLDSATDIHTEVVSFGQQDEARKA